MVGIGYNRYIYPRIYRSFLARLQDPSPALDVPVAPGLDLGQPYPNPFNPSTSFTLTLQQDTRVRLDICDARGRLIRVLHDGMLSTGHHFMQWDGRLDNGRIAPSGLYLARLKDDGGRTQTRRMMLVK